MQEQTFYLVSIIATSIGFSLTIGSLWVLYRQIVVTRRSRDVELIVRFYETSTKDPLYSDFNTVWNIKDQNKLSEKEEKSAFRVCLFFEMIGSVATQRYVDTTLIEEYFGSLVVECYDKLCCHIDLQRSKPYNSKFAINFEKLKLILEQSSRISRLPGHHEITMKDKFFKIFRAKKPF